MNRTTTKLRLTFAQWWLLHERQIRDVAAGAAMIVALLLIHALLRPAEPAPLAPVVMREAQRPVILLQTTTPAPTQPTATPWPTAEPQVIYVPGPTAEPIIVEIPVYVAAEPEPPAEAQPTLAPQQLVILDRQQWAQQAAER